MKALLIFLLLYQLPPNWKYSERELAEKKAAIEYWDQLADKELPPYADTNDFIRRLGDGVMKTSPKRVKPALGGEKVFFKLQARLLSIPGHATYYRDRMNESRRLMEEAKAADPMNYGRAFGRLDFDRMVGFETLENLPSPETVGVLGEFLSDDRGSQGRFRVSDDAYDTPFSMMAVGALWRLGIASPPAWDARSHEDVMAAKEAWKIWYQQVKNGRRTFRLIGDPVDYDLRGPSKRGEVVPTERISKRKGEEGYDDVKAGDSGSDANRLPWYMALGMLVAGLVFHFLRRRGLGR